MADVVSKAVAAVVKAEETAMSVMVSAVMEAAVMVAEVPLGMDLASPRMILCFQKALFL